jgi:hypothetical protein
VPHSARCLCARCLAAISDCAGASRTTPWSTSIHRLIRDHVEVVIDETSVRILHGTTVVATHPRVHEPFARVSDPAHFAGLWRPATTPVAAGGTLAALGRDLADYDAIIAGGAR